LRGRSAAAAALSMAKDAAVASTIFIMTIPLMSGQHRLREAPDGGNRRGTPPSSHHHLARAVSTAARFNDALTELATQRKSACITCNADPFRESVARIARTRRWQARRIPVLDAGLTRVRCCGDQRTTFGRDFAACAQPRSIRIFFKPSRFGESAAATHCDRYRGTARQGRNRVGSFSHNPDLWSAVNARQEEMSRCGGPR
jgi:hypothetical protein